MRGRWWQTATTLTAVNLLAGLVGLVVSLGLLVVFASVPIWLFSSLVTLVYALTTPMAAAAVTLLYGDAVAQAEGADTADLVADTAAV